MDPLRQLTADECWLLYEDFGDDFLASSFHSESWARRVARVAGADGITFGSRVLLVRASGWRDGALLRLAAHELAHVVQYRKVGFWRFLALYVGEYVALRLRGRSHHDAYLEISFEREARQVEERFG